MSDAELIQHAVLCQLHKRTLIPEQADRLIELARLGASVVGAHKMWIDENGHMTETPERFDFYVLIVKNVLAGEGDK